MPLLPFLALGFGADACGLGCGVVRGGVELRDFTSDAGLNVSCGSRSFS